MMSMVRAKQFRENSGCNSRSFPSKLQKSEFVQRFPANCGASGGVKVTSDKMHPKANVERDIVEKVCAVSNTNSPTNVKRRKAVAARAFLEDNGSIAHRELFASVENIGCSVAYKCTTATPVVLLRALPPLIDCELSKSNFVETPLGDKKLGGKVLAKFITTDSSTASVEYDDIGDGVTDNRVGYRHSGNPKDLINLSTVPYNHSRAIKAREVLKLFEVKYDELVKESREVGVGRGIYLHSVLISRLKKMGMLLLPEKPFGHIPVVQIGDEFRYRSELAAIGLHNQLMAGIDYVVVDGKKFATSVINSGRYENQAKALDVLIYSGHGGKGMFARKAVDQKLERGNIALMNSMEMKLPVRVTFKKKSLVATNALGMSNEGNFVYVYDGLYTINRMWQERDCSGKLVFKFEMQRMLGQPRPHRTCVKERKERKEVKMKEVCIVPDISLGKENVPIRAMNGVDNDRYPSFTYLTNILYPTWFQPVEPLGCDCTNGCSDAEQCPCVLKNGGQIPFNEKGEIIKARSIIHECGPSCKCPPFCMNRVTQQRPRYELQIFKTKAGGWGVRSRHFISSGSFICEYVGELFSYKKDTQRTHDDEYLLHISDDAEYQGFQGSKSKDDFFAIDAAKFGNVARFINHSCTPNLYVQNVLYDHDDKRMPHVMFFAKRNIPPRQELTCDFNCKID